MSDHLGKVLGPTEGRIERVARWIREWDLSTSQQKALWQLMLDHHSGDGHILYESALRYFALHGAADLKGTPALRDRIVTAIVTTLSSPELFRCDELAQAPVVA